MRNGEAIKPPNRRGSVRWPLIIVGLLGAHVILMVGAGIIAVRDPRFSVEPNYYQRAVHWDEHRAELAASAKLGWRVVIEPAATVDASGQRQVAFVLTDAAGHAVPGATLTVEYFHHAHGDQMGRATLSPGSDARRFEQALPMPYAGLWEFHFTATAGGKTFVSMVQQEIENSAHTARGAASAGPRHS